MCGWDAVERGRSALRKRKTKGRAGRLTGLGLLLALAAGCAFLTEGVIADGAVRVGFVNDHNDWGAFGERRIVAPGDLDAMVAADGVLDPGRAGTALLLVRAENRAPYEKKGALVWKIRIVLISPEGERRAVPRAYDLVHGGYAPECYTAVGLPYAWFRAGGPGAWRVEIRVGDFRSVTRRLLVLPEGPGRRPEDEDFFAVV